MVFERFKYFAVKGVHLTHSISRYLDYSLRVGFAHEAKEMRAACLRAIRYYLQDRGAVDSLILLHIDYLIARYGFGILNLIKSCLTLHSNFVINLNRQLNYL